jgi:ribosomal-protein-serine acetyltransferase
LLEHVTARRFSIRPYRIEDADACYRAIMQSVDTLSDWMPWAEPTRTLEAQQAWVASKVEAFRNRTEFEFAIVSMRGRYVGGCGLNRIDTVNQRANLGYWVKSSATGQGAATAATRLLVEWGFANTELERLEVIVSTRNPASLRVAQKAGAVREGVLKKRLLLHGEWHDAVMHAFTRT